MPYILVVEDDIDARAILVLCLQDAGFKTVAASNGLEALNFICDPKRESKPYLILLDLYMPVMTGQQFINVMSSCDHMTSIPIVIVSGSDIVIAGYRTLRKPFNFDELVEVARRARSTPPVPR